MKALGLIIPALFVFNAWAADYSARNCEIFVDKVVESNFSSWRIKNQGVVFFVKILADRLDAPVKSVVFFGTSSGYAGKTGVNYPLKAFADSKDYYQLAVGVFGSDADVGSGSTTYTATFYVETEKGTKYWVNAANDWNFTIDRNFATSIQSKYNPGPVAWAPAQMDVNSYVKTADVDAPSAESYLNPGRCR